MDSETAGLPSIVEYGGHYWNTDGCEGINPLVKIVRKAVYPDGTSFMIYLKVPISDLRDPEHPDDPVVTRKQSPLKAGSK